MGSTAVVLCGARTSILGTPVERADAQIEVDEPNNVDVRRRVDRAHTRPTALKSIIYVLSILQFVQNIVLTTKTVHRKNDVLHSLNPYRTL